MFIYTLSYIYYALKKGFYLHCIFFMAELLLSEFWASHPILGSCFGYFMFLYILCIDFLWIYIILQFKRMWSSSR